MSAVQVSVIKTHHHINHISVHAHAFGTSLSCQFNAAAGGWVRFRLLPLHQIHQCACLLCGRYALAVSSVRAALLLLEAECGPGF